MPTIVTIGIAAFLSACFQMTGGALPPFSRARQLERGRHPLDNEIERGLAVAHRLAEVAAQRAREEARVLDEERIVESHRLAEALHVLGRRIRRQQDEGRVAREVEDEEDDERDAEKDEQRLEQPTGEVRPHGARRRPATASMCAVCGNMSTGCTHSRRYPSRTRSPRSRASVAGLQET